MWLLLFSYVAVAIALLQSNSNCHIILFGVSVNDVAIRLIEKLMHMSFHY